MNPHKLDMPAWQKGLIKRKWIYLLVVLVSLVILGDSGQRMRHTALRSLFLLKISNHQT